MGHLIFEDLSASSGKNPDSKYLKPQYKHYGEKRKLFKIFSLDPQISCTVKIENSSEFTKFTVRALVY